MVEIENPDPPAVVEKITKETTRTGEAATVPPIPPVSEPDRSYDETTRRRLMYLLVGGFLLYSVLLAALMALKGWELSPTANAIVIMTLQAIITSMTAAISYYFGTTMGSSQKGAMITQLQNQAAAKSNG